MSKWDMEDDQYVFFKATPRQWRRERIKKFFYGVIVGVIVTFMLLLIVGSTIG